MKQIALVEDNADSRTLLKILLERSYQIDEYENGLDALEGIRLHKPDLVIMDIFLPGMNGDDVLRRIREDSELRDLPVVAFTAHSTEHDRRKYLAIGFDEYISKPIVDVEFFRRTIDAHVR